MSIRAKAKSAVRGAADTSANGTLSPRPGPGLDPIARSSFSVFIARRAFDPGLDPVSVCYAPRVAHGDLTAPETCDSVSRLNETRERERGD